MSEDTAQALKIFTASWCQHWQDSLGHGPLSSELYGIPSPCVITTSGEQVFWQPQPFQPAADLRAVGQALDIEIQPSVSAFYTTQFAGEMTARFDGLDLQLSQVWSPDDFSRTQENLIGHLLMKRRLKQTPTLFIATTGTDLDVVSVCNLTGAVVLERLGSKQRQSLANSLYDFLAQLQPVIS
ncbi:SecY-interacting protein [Izhakiella australiensis]|uniref:Protein Syd n=1 Tax=Izhakiella australiensis TaxID=1926881 RepID=A0A1S8YKX6_9GAMM|nr:SecY-interacting protein [Izhakiella australiensis]OON39592.1 SecY-interacting protein [Izhakiella australiensis]